MQTITLRNTFHDTTCRIRPGRDGSVSPRTARRIRTALCSADCQCADTVLGTRGVQLPPWTHGLLEILPRPDGGALIRARDTR